MSFIDRGDFNKKVNDTIGKLPRVDRPKSSEVFPGTRPGFFDPDERIVKKDTNPKDAVGIRKAPVSTVSHGVMMEVGLGMLEGARKYGRHNYRESGVRASVYRDALWRHITAWWDFGQDIDPDSGIHHLSKAIASLMVLRDAQLMDNWVDDRPPALPIELLEEYNRLAGEIIDRHPDAKDPVTNESFKRNK